MTRAHRRSGEPWAEVEAAGLAVRPPYDPALTDYDPRLGRFLEVDPVEGGSCNDYDYVCGDPVNGYDLDGRLFGVPGLKVPTPMQAMKIVGKAIAPAMKSAGTVLSHIQASATLCPVFGCVQVAVQGGHLTVGGGVGLAVAASGSACYNQSTAKAGTSTRNVLFAEAGPVAISYSAPQARGLSHGSWGGGAGGGGIPIKVRGTEFGFGGGFVQMHSRTW